MWRREARKLPIARSQGWLRVSLKRLGIRPSSRHQVLILSVHNKPLLRGSIQALAKQPIERDIERTGRVQRTRFSHNHPISGKLSIVSTSSPMDGIFQCAHSL